MIDATYFTALTIMDSKIAATFFEQTLEPSAFTSAA